MITKEQMQLRLAALVDGLESIDELPQAHQVRQMAKGVVEIDLDLYNRLRAHAVYVLEVRRRAAAKMLDLLLED